MMKLLPGALLVALAAGPAGAADCTPRCDFVHDYGPYDFTYARPGLYGWPHCGPTGECAPYLTYVWQRPRIVIPAPPRWRRLRNR